MLAAKDIPELVLLPRPRFLELTGGSFHLPHDGQIVFEGLPETDKRLQTEC